MALRVASAPCFKKAVRLREFLLYVCQKAITNQLGDVREQEIGKAVFGRRSEYNAGDDNIVRVEARELRKRLDLFFSTDGRDEPIVIVIPKGSYVPLFEPRHQAPVAESSISADTSVSTVHDAPPVTLERKHSSLAMLALAACLLICLMAAAWLLQQNIYLHRNLAGSGVIAEPEQDGLWRLLFDSERETLMVLSDTCWLQLEGMLHHQKSLRDYLSREYFSDLKTPDMQSMASCQYTDIADANLVSKIMEAAHPYSRKLFIRSARTLAIEDLKTQNLILVGGHLSNPWVEEFEPQLPFRDESDLLFSPPFYSNRSPRPGEGARFYTTKKNGSWEDTYGTISFLPNLTHHGNVLIINGSVSEGTEAAGDFLCEPSFTNQLRKHLRLGPKDPIPHFELLLKISVLPGSPVRAEYLAHRILPD